MLGIRWTIGDVSPRGFEALRLSIWGAWRLFGADANYCVCVNTVSVERARSLVGSVPEAVAWLAADAMLPDWLHARHLDTGLAEGVAWKLAPLRCFPEGRELSLDNDVILWEVPAAVAAWLADDGPDRCLLAADVTSALGQFDSLCERRALNSGIRGLPAGVDIERRLRARHWDEHRAELYQKVGIEPELSESSMQGG